MQNAQQNKYIADQYNKIQKLPALFQHLPTSINREAKRGGYNLTVYEHLYGTTKQVDEELKEITNYLEYLGYQVTTDTKQTADIAHDITLTVSWE